MIDEKREWTRGKNKNDLNVKILVVKTVEVHLFPFRTQKLSQLVPMVVHLIDVRE